MGNYQIEIGAKEVAMALIMGAVTTIVGLIKRSYSRDLKAIEDRTVVNAEALKKIAEELKDITKNIMDRIERERNWRIEDDEKIKVELKELMKKLNVNCRILGEVEKVCNERHKGAK